MKIRYYAEHVAFYKLFAKDPIKVISKILTEKENYIYNTFLAIYDEKQEAFPFQEKDFSVKLSSYDQMEFITITMPEAFMEPSLCHKIILAYSMNLDLYEYFTVEDGKDPVFGKYLILGGWSENCHYTYSTINDNDVLEEKICDIAFVE